jgi:hypothetical protein
MKALILDTQVCQVEEQDFPVAEPLYWVACPNDVTTEWSYVENTFVPPPLPSTPTAEENKATSVGLLNATDWTTIADVGNPQMSNPYLANQAEFIAYRNAVRQYAVYPVAGNIDWATVPQEVWQAV